MTPAMKGAVEWLRKRGGSCAVATTSAKGRVFLAQGDIAPIVPATMRRLIDAGVIERYEEPPGVKRLRLAE